MNIPVYARFLNSINNVKKISPDPEFDGCDDVLAFLAIAKANGSAVKITDLVQSLQFGSGPTVHRKISVLAERSMIDIFKNENDGRAKILFVTAKGLAFLNERSKLLKSCLIN